jgi:hypothetical protein
VRWNSTFGWQDLGGESFLGEVTSLAFDKSTDRIFAVGRSTDDSVSPFVFLQVFSDSAWNTLLRLTVTNAGNSFNVVRCYAGWVYVGGLFTQFNVVAATQNIVRFPAFDVYAIDTMGGGVTGPVFDIVQYKTGVLVGGNFADAGFPPSLSVNDLAYYDGHNWKTLGTFHEFYHSEWQVMSLDTLVDGAVVAAGVFFNVSGGLRVNNIAVFNETINQWGSVGVIGSDAALTPYTISSAVFADKHQVMAFGFSTLFGENLVASYLEQEGWAFEKQALLETGLITRYFVLQLLLFFFYFSSIMI